VSTNYSPKIVTTDLVMYLDAKNSKSYPGSGDTWYDLSGNGNNGTLTNGATISDGTCYLDGLGVYSSDLTGGYVYVNVDTTKTNNYTDVCTWSWWMYILDSQPNGQRIFHYDSTKNHIEIKDEGASGYFRTEAALTNGYEFDPGSPPGGVPLLTWQSYAIVWDNEASPRTVKWYKNGSLFFTDGDFDDGYSGTEEYASFDSIGRAGGTVQYPYTESFYGYIPIVQVYGNKLSAAQVKQNYDALKGRFGL